MRPVLTIATLLTLCWTSPARAQLGFLDKVFAGVTDVNASYLIGSSLKGNELAGGQWSLHGVGIEVALSLGPLLSSEPHPTCAKKKVEYVRTQREIRSRDTTYIETPKEVPGDPPDSVTLDAQKLRRYKKACNETPSLDAEVSFGYSQMGGFTGRTMRMQGALENLPVVAFYLIWSTETWVDAYLGIRTGLAQLKGFQAFPSDTGRVTAAGSTWQVGLAPGITVGKPGFRGVLFVEAELMYRRFDEIQWTAVIGPVPAELRGPTHLSTLVISVGGQIEIGK